MPRDLGLTDGPFNTGAAVLPHDGDLFAERVAAAVAVLNGSGEVYGRGRVEAST